MTFRVDLGTERAGVPFALDLEELLATRLLVQGNSGSGKSHLLRRLLERSAGEVQQVVVDPEGDFVTLAERYGHVVVSGDAYSERELARIATRIREHRASVVLSLENLDTEGQMRCAATFLNALFEVGREHWYPALVVVDEAQLFAPAVGGDTSEEVRRASLGAMTNLMCRGRKRGLAGIIATQRLAKLAKNVAAEASNFLMGRTFLDIDMARAADLLGMERRQAEEIRDLERGTFLALGPALSRRPVAVRIGPVETGGTGSTPRLSPLPTASSADLKDLLFAPVVEELPPPPPAPKPRVLASEALIASITTPAPAAIAEPERTPEEAEAIVADVLTALVADHEASGRPASLLYQDFQLRCRMAGLSRPPLDLAGFGRRLACARAGIADPADPDWAGALELAQALPDEMLAPFLLIVRAARDGLACPSDDDLAASYGTSSLGRIRRLLAYIEDRNLIVCRTDLGGRRTISLPHLGWTTAPAEAARLRA
jgi:uncharacterized protein